LFNWLVNGLFLIYVVHYLSNLILDKIIDPESCSYNIRNVFKKHNISYQNKAIFNINFHYDIEMNSEFCNLDSIIENNSTFKLIDYYFSDKNFALKCELFKNGNILKNEWYLMFISFLILLLLFMINLKHSFFLIISILIQISLLVTISFFNAFFSTIYVFNIPITILVLILCFSDTYVWSFCYKKRKKIQQEQLEKNNEKIVNTLDKLLNDIIINVFYYIVPKSCLYILYFLIIFLFNKISIIKLYSTFGLFTFIFYYFLVSSVYASLFIFTLKFNILKYLKYFSVKIKLDLFNNFKHCIIKLIVQYITNLVLKFHILWYVLFCCASVTSLLSIFYLPKLYLDENIFNVGNSQLKSNEIDSHFNFFIVWDIGYRENNRIKLNNRIKEKYNLSSEFCRYLFNYTKKREKYKNQRNLEEYLKMHTNFVEYTKKLLYSYRHKEKLIIKNFTFFGEKINSENDCKSIYKKRNTSSLIYVETDVKFTKNILEIKKMNEIIEYWWRNVSNELKFDNNKIWWATEQFEDYEIQFEMNKAFIICLLCPFIFIFACLLIATRNVFTSTYATLTIFFILSSTIACTVWLGWRIDCLTCLLYLFVLYFSTHYCILYTVYVHFTRNLRSHNRLKCSIKTICVPLFQNTINFVLSAIPLLFSLSKFLNKTAIIIILSSILSFLYSTLFLQSTFRMKSNFYNKSEAPIVQVLNEGQLIFEGKNYNDKNKKITKSNSIFFKSNEIQSKQQSDKATSIRNANKSFDGKVLENRISSLINPNFLIPTGNRTRTNSQNSFYQDDSAVSIASTFI
jgi:hypothetical protein